jgi:predicted NBD/HSP70 family sugar kinase
VHARFKVPVQVDNDANMAALGERWQGVARAANDFVFIALRRRGGAGIVHRRARPPGHHWHAGKSAAWCSTTASGRSISARAVTSSRIGAAAIPELAQARSVLAEIRP